MGLWPACPGSAGDSAILSTPRNANPREAIVHYTSVSWIRQIPLIARFPVPEPAFSPNELAGETTITRMRERLLRST